MFFRLDQLFNSRLQSPLKQLLDSCVVPLVVTVVQSLTYLALSSKDVVSSWTRLCNGQLRYTPNAGWTNLTVTGSNTFLLSLAASIVAATNVTQRRLCQQGTKGNTMA